MTPQILKVGVTQVDWAQLRKLVADATGLSPSAQVSQCPVNLSEFAETVLFPAYMTIDSSVEENAHNLLTKLPRESFEFLHYTFLIGCNRDTVDDLREKTNAHYAIVDAGSAYCILGTGSLSVWVDAITMNLCHPRLGWKSATGTRTLLNKLMLLLEKDGLSAIFNKYKKKTIYDKTFLLEN